MALTPSPKVSPSVVMKRSELGLISWSSHLLLRCLRMSSWDGLNLDSYHGPHTFCLRCLHLSSCGGLYLGSFHDPHTFCLRFLHSSSCGSLYLGSFHGPHTFLPEVSSSVMKRSHPPSSGMSPMTLRFSTTMWTWERSLPSHRKRELRRTPRNLPSYFLCLELLCLSSW